MNDDRSIAEQALSFTGMFEAELLTQLILREWKHPLAENEEFRNGVLEAAAQVLQSSVNGDQVAVDISPQNMNFVAALAIAETEMLDNDVTVSTAERAARESWIENMKRSIPSCFCDPDLLR